MAERALARRLRYAVEGAAAAALFALLGALPTPAASALGGAFGRLLGPLLGVNRRARQNLVRVLPEESPARVKRTLRAMWAHLGRVAAEYPHLKSFHPYRAGGRIEVVGTEHLAEAKRAGRGGIFFSGHIGNWEVAALAVTQYGIPVALIYRAPNNPVVDRLIWRARGPVADFRVPKGPSGARDIVRYLKGGGHLAMLVDQKMNDGISVPFFGHEAMTAPALAELALKYDCPVYPVRVERLAGARFRITVFPKMALPRSCDRAADVQATMRLANALLEEWIRARPEQWLWPHRRWPD
jgi:KDO2-lipid IV(A) lauroyltransferase